MENLKKTAIDGFIWSFTGNFANQIITFVFGIILARLLTPKEFGLIGMITVFIVISQTFIDSGFKQALIRKIDCTDDDYSTVFFFNLAVAILIYVILFITSPLIGQFFDEPILSDLVKVLAFGLIINSFSIIQGTILNKKIDFKTEAKISFSANLISGVISIYLAYVGYGVWSLVWRSILSYLLSTSFLWYFNKWRPKAKFNFNSFKELFGYGSKILASNIIDQFFWNIYYIVIGKYFSAQTLGYYTRAEMFKNLISQNFTQLISKVAFPTLVLVSVDKNLLLNSHNKLVKITTFIVSLFLITMFAITDKMVPVLLGNQWNEVIPLLKLLLLSTFLFTASLLNQNLLKIKGLSGLILKIEMVKKIFTIPIIFIGIFIGLYEMIVGIIFLSVFDYLVNSYFALKSINYTILKQLLDFKNTYIIIFIVLSVEYFIGLLRIENNVLSLLILLFGILFILWIFSEIFNFYEYNELKKIAWSKLKLSKL